MNARKKARLFIKIKAAIVAAIIFAAITYASNSDYETYKQECNAGIRICHANAQ